MVNLSGFPNNSAYIYSALFGHIMIHLSSWKGMELVVTSCKVGVGWIVIDGVIVKPPINGQK